MQKNLDAYANSNGTQEAVDRFAVQNTHGTRTRYEARLAELANLATALEAMLLIAECAQQHGALAYPEVPALPEVQNKIHNSVCPSQW